MFTVLYLLAFISICLFYVARVYVVYQRRRAILKSLFGR